MGDWRQRWHEENLDWENAICISPGCAAHVAVLFDTGDRDGGYPLCVDCADRWLDRLCARELIRAARSEALPLPPAYA